jgi:hypothetical protein
MAERHAVSQEVTSVLDEKVVRELTAGIGSGDPEARDESADQVTDVVKALDKAQANQLARALAKAALSEDIDDCRESELNALDELTVWHAIDHSILTPLFSLNKDSFGESEREYLDNLQAYAEGRS